MPKLAQFDGSKAKTRQREAAERAQAAQERAAVAEFQEDLGKIEDLTAGIETPEQFETILADVPDEAARAEVRKLLEPLLPWNQKRLVLATDDDLQRMAQGPAPEKATTIVLGDA